MGVFYNRTLSIEYANQHQQKGFAMSMSFDAFNVQVSRALERANSPFHLQNLFYKFMEDPEYYKDTFEYLTNPEHLYDAEYSDIFKDAMGYRPYMSETRRAVTEIAEWMDTQG